MKPPTSPAASGTSAGSGRIALAALALAILWVLTYWFTPTKPVASRPIVFFDQPTTPRESLGASILVEPKAEEVVAAHPESDQPGDQVAQPPRIVPPEFNSYILERGDTPHTIAQKLYGDSGYWRVIHRANPFVDFSRVRAGREIRIPVDPRNVQGVLEDELGHPPIPEPAYTEYIVSEGDTLSGIAKALYGRASHWRIIRDANPGKINSEGTNIRPGMVLLIPPPPDTVRN